MPGLFGFRRDRSERQAPGRSDVEAPGGPATDTAQATSAVTVEPGDLPAPIQPGDLDSAEHPDHPDHTAGMVEIIRPAAIVPEHAARLILVELARRDLSNGGLWQSEPQLWSRFDRPLPEDEELKALAQGRRISKVGDVPGAPDAADTPNAADGADSTQPTPDPVDPPVLLGTIHVTYGTPTKYEITLYRVTVTPAGVADGWTVASLTDEALGFGNMTLDQCPRATVSEPPRPFNY